jgi:hypothetical protein
LALFVGRERGRRVLVEGEGGGWRFRDECWRSFDGSKWLEWVYQNEEYHHQKIVLGIITKK